MQDVRFIGGPLDGVLKAFEKPPTRLIVASSENWEVPGKLVKHVYELEAGVYMHRGIERA